MTVENISIDVKTNAGSAASQFRSLSSALGGVRSAGKGIASGGAHKSISRIGSAAKSATKHTSKLLSSLKRIAMYRLLRTFIKELSQAFQEGLKNAYAFSKAIGGSLAQALDGLKSATGQMKNQMGAAFGELLQTVMPIINAIVSAITSLMRALSALFAALGGRLTYTVAEKTAESWDDAAGAAKEYKNTVLGFDELNKLNDETGGGGGGADGQGAFGELELPDWAKKIKEAIDMGDWYAAGEALADWLNKLIEDWDAYESGRKLGEKINNMINFALGFLRRFKFERLGQKVAQFFNGMLSEIETDKLGAVIVRLITGPIDFLIGFIEDLDAKQLGSKLGDFFKGIFSEATDWLNEHNWRELGKTITTKISDFLSNLKADEVAVLLSGFLTRLFISATNLLLGMDTGDVAFNLTDQIKKFFENIDWERLGQTLSTFLTTLLEKIGEFFEGGDWEGTGADIGKSIRTFVENIDWKKIVQTAWDALGEAVNALGGFAGGFIAGLFGGVGDADITEDVQGTIDEIKLILADASMVIGAVLLFSGANIPLGLGLLIGGIAAHDKVTENWDSVSNTTKEKITVIETAASAALIALGIILTLSGAAIPLGLGLIAVGAVMLATQKREDWDLVPEQTKSTLALIGTLAGVLLVGLGIILILTGVGIGLGLGCILAGSAVLAGVVAFSIDGTKNEINGAMESVGQTGETQFGKIADAILKIIDAVSSVIDWFERMKTAIGEVNSRLNDIEGHKATYGDAWGEMVRGAEIGAWASGGSIPNSDGTLFVAGEAGAEVVANMGSRTGVMNVDQMEAAVANGNIGVINAVYQMANMIVKALNEIDPDITLDGESLADKMYNYNQNAARRRGVAMVT